MSWFKRNQKEICRDTLQTAAKKLDRMDERLKEMDSKLDELLMSPSKKLNSVLPESTNLLEKK